MLLNNFSSDFRDPDRWRKRPREIQIIIPCATFSGYTRKGFWHKLRNRPATIRRILMICIAAEAAAMPASLFFQERERR